jgi:hypothetical protein
MAMRAKKKAPPKRTARIPGGAKTKGVGSPRRAEQKSSGKTRVRAKQTPTRPKTQAKQGAPRTEAQYAAKPETFKDTWDRVIDAISKMRSGKVSLTQAAREARVSPRTVTKWGKSALRKGKSGKYAVKKNDNLLRVLVIPTPEGMRPVSLLGSKQASLLGEYSNAVSRYLQTGDATKLMEFRGQHITDANGVDIPLIVDREVLNRLGSAGVLSFESLYARST